jgi:DNA-binding NtrC family response regulator
MPFRVLIVDQVTESRAAVEQILTAAGHFVTSVSGFHEAKHRMMFTLPDVLVTTLKLGAYNGIQLVLRAQDNGTRMAAIVVHDSFDAVLEREAVDAGAVFTTTPLDAAELLALIDRLLAAADLRTAVERKWPRKPADVPVDISGQAAKVVEISYGGLRLELIGDPGETIARIEQVRVPAVGTLPIHPIWARGGEAASHLWWCGAEIDAADDQTAQAWRRFVDSV